MAAQQVVPSDSKLRHAWDDNIVRVVPKHRFVEVAWFA